MSTEPKVNTHAVYNAVWGVNFKPAAVKLIALAYAKFADPDGSNVFPGRAKIMELTGYSVDAVRDATDYLIGLGVLRVIREHTTTKPRQYAIDLDVLHQLAAGGEHRAAARPRKDHEPEGRAPTTAGAPQGANPSGWGAHAGKTGRRAPTQPSRHQPGGARGGPARPPADAVGQARQKDYLRVVAP